LDLGAEKILRKAMVLTKLIAVLEGTLQDIDKHPTTVDVL
jgi:hypothetical protein